MKERVLAKIRTSATPPQATQANSPLLHQSSLTSQLSESVGSNSNISTELGGIQPKTIRRSLNWQNITVEAPSRGNGMSLPGGIQRQQEELSAVSGARVSADSVQKSPLESSNSTISTDLSAQKPLIARAPFNGRNIPVEAPSRGNGMSLPGGIQRQQEELPAVSGARVSADSVQKSPLESSNSTISTDLSAQKPLIARAPFNGRNIPVEAPPRSSASSTYPGGIQRLETSGVKEPEESTETLQMQPQGAIQAKSSEAQPQEKEEQNQELVQTKLTVGAPGDKYEQEADSMAAKVMTMPDSAIKPPIQRQTGEETEAVQMQPLVNSITPLLQRSSEEEEEAQMKSEVQRASDGSSVASGNVENQLAASKGGGSALPDNVRSFMEPRFGADFSNIKVHTDSNAVQMNKELGAQAFAHGSDIYYGAGKSPGNNELTAHELTHTIQQGAAVRMNKEVRRQPQQEEEQETIQAKEISISRQENSKQVSLSNKENSFQASGAETETLAAKALSGYNTNHYLNKELRQKPQEEEEETTQEEPIQAKQLTTPPFNNKDTIQAKEISISGQENSKQVSLSNKESSFQASEAETETVAAKALSGYNTNHYLNKELRQKPQEEEQETTQEEPIQAKQLTNTPPFNNKNTIQRQSLAVTSVSPRIQGDFLGIGNPIDKIKGAIAGFAKQLPGYPLLTLILGKDPVSDAPVQRNATNLIRGMLSLVPNGDKIFNNLQQSGSLQKAFGWFNGEVAKLNLTWNAIKGLFGKALSSLGIKDALNPMGAFEKVKNVFVEPIGRIKNFAVSAGTKVMEFAFEGFLNTAGGAGAKVMGILRKAGGAFTSILKNPVAFCGNLVGAVRGGCQKFSGNVATHLKNGLTGWLFGALAGSGLTVPAQFDTKGIVSMVLQVLGATYSRLRGKLTSKIGQQKVGRLEKTFDFLRTIVTGGLGTAWQKISEFAGNLQEMVIGGIKEWVMHSVITAAITKLISMFNPAGAIIQAVMAIYNTVMFFIERGSQIAALAQAVFSSIGNIAAGNVAGAANYVEQTMGRSLPVMISFLARLIGLGGVSEHIKNVIKKIQTPIENAMNKLAKFIVEKGKSLLGKGDKRDREAGGEQSPQTDKRTLREKELDLNAAVKKVQKIAQKPDITPEAVQSQLPNLQKQYRLTKLELVKSQDNKYLIHGQVNPSVTLPLPSLNSGDTAVNTKLVSLGFFRSSPNDVSKITTNLKTTNGGDAIASYITSGKFDACQGYSDLLSQIKDKGMLPSVFMAMREAERLMNAGHKNIVFEEKSDSPYYDMDVAVVDPSGSYSMVYQLKYIDNNGSLSKNATKAAKQLENAPATDKWVVIEVKNGTWADFQSEGRETGINTTFKSQYPSVKLRVKFSDGTEKEF